jgi:hypothetical protein
VHCFAIWEEELAKASSPVMAVVTAAIDSDPASGCWGGRHCVSYDNASDERLS